MSTELATVPNYSVSDLQVMAKQVAASRLFAGVETEQAAFTLMMLCQAEGLHPATAIRRYHIIKGRPTMRADAMQAEFQDKGGLIRWVRSDAFECAARFVHPVHAPEPGVTVSLSMEEAQERGLTTNALYGKFPSQMLRARVISEGVRMVLPGVIVGIYSAEEVESTTGMIDPNPVSAEVLASQPQIETTSKAEVNATFAPAGAPSRPANDKEVVKLSGDRIGARGLDVRLLMDVFTQEVERANAAVRKACDERGIVQPSAVTSYQVVNHLVTWVGDQGVEIPLKNGKREGAGKLGAFLSLLYLETPAWRNAIRKEIKRYLKSKYDAAVESPQQQFNLAPDDDDEPVDAELVEPSGQVADGEADGWQPGRE